MGLLSRRSAIFFVVLAVWTASTVRGTSTTLGLENGWYPCSITTFSNEFRSDSEAEDARNDSTREGIAGQSATEQTFAQPECAQLMAPLFHATPKDQTIPLFVKRVMAISANPESAPNLWFIQGGPGASSVAMEDMMQSVYQITGGQVNVYTLDHRGTGRSARLDCEAAQATTSGSPGGSTVLPKEFASCSDDLRFQFGDDLSCFSITSAASDIAWLIDELQAKTEVFVYGVSYGTAVVERLIHLNVPEIMGYILDGVATSSGAGPAQNFEYFSTWDTDYGEIGDRFLELCKNDAFCAQKFGNKGPAQTLRDLYLRLDDPIISSALQCAELAASLSQSADDPLSYVLRAHLASLLQDETSRVLIPALLYRIDRCNSQDQDVLAYYFNSTVLNSMMQQSPDSYSSDLLYQLITFSEMWETPPPQMDVMKARFTDQLLSNGQMYKLLPANCLYRLDFESPGCKEFDVADKLPNDVLPMAYKPDEFWNVSASIPKQSSVLLMNGRLDPQTNYRYAQYLYESLKGSANQKKLLTFDFASHVVVNAGATVDNPIPCGMQILAAYVLLGGDLSQLDTSCMQAYPPLNFEIDAQLSLVILGTSDALNGALEMSLADKLVQQVTKPQESNAGNDGLVATPTSSTSSSSNTKYETLFIVFVTLFALSLVVIGVLMVQLQRLKHPKQHPQYGDVYRSSTPTSGTTTNVNVNV